MNIEIWPIQKSQKRIREFGGSVAECCVGQYFESFCVRRHSLFYNNCIWTSFSSKPYLDTCRRHNVANMSAAQQSSSNLLSRFIVNPTTSSGSSSISIETSPVDPYRQSCSHASFNQMGLLEPTFETKVRIW